MCERRILSRERALTEHFLCENNATAAETTSDLFFILVNCIHNTHSWESKIFVLLSTSDSLTVIPK